MDIDYLDDHFSDYKMIVAEPKNWRTTQSGYGKKLPTRYMIVFNKPKKRCRVYATCFSNVASLWVKVMGKTYFVREDYNEQAS